MMRYRRTRASTTEAAAGIGSNIGKSWVGGDANGGTAQGHAGYVGGQQQQSGGFANNMSRMFYAGGAKAQVLIASLFQTKYCQICYLLSCI